MRTQFFAAHFVGASHSVPAANSQTARKLQPRADICHSMPGRSTAISVPDGIDGHHHGVLDKLMESTGAELAWFPRVARAGSDPKLSLCVPIRRPVMRHGLIFVSASSKKEIK
jgi:hypothetical protein